MAPRLIPLCGLLFLGILSPSIQAATDETARCPDALRQAFEGTSNNSQATTLPDTCRAIGPVKLGMSKTQVLAALGRPDKEITTRDHPENLDVVYVYPRDLNAQMARNPVPASKMYYSELGIRLDNGVVKNIVIFANVKAPPPFKILGHAIGSDIGGILKEIGGSAEWNSSKDYVQYQMMPIGISVDPDTQGIVGLGIADHKQDLDTFDAPGLILIKDNATGLFKGFQ